MMACCSHELLPQPPAQYHFSTLALALRNIFILIQYLWLWRKWMRSNMKTLTATCPYHFAASCTAPLSAHNNVVCDYYELFCEHTSYMHNIYIYKRIYSKYIYCSRKWAPLNHKLKTIAQKTTTKKKVHTTPAQPYPHVYILSTLS